MKWARAAARSVLEVIFSVWAKPCQQKKNPLLDLFPASSKAGNRWCKLGCNLLWSC